ncbi:MAG: glutathione peroxidase [Betaproteobacteria bacterium]|nr:MAG: glutathione peroxidase [Betaproteobacteria bacterium]
MKRFLSLLLAFVITSAHATTPAILNHTLNPLLPGKPIALSQYAGKAVLVVNVASRCGFTPQYAGLETLYKRYESKGLVILGIPANDFGAQELASNKDIAEFCQKNYGVSFPMFEKLDAPLPRQPFHAALIKATGQAPQWNFHKYLIDRGGKVTSFSSNVEPLSPTLVSAIESALNSKR